MGRIVYARRQSGTVLVLALWALSLLTIFALNLGAGIRQKITLISRLEQRDKLRLIAEAGIEKAIALLNNDFSKDNNPVYTAQRKADWHNNRFSFGDIQVDGGRCEVSYEYTDGALARGQKYYGVVDEERKININKADALTLANLFGITLGGKEEETKALADAIVDWREYGESEMSGFYSDEYYQNLQYSYSPKNADFETMDELLLVKGIGKNIFEAIAPYLTVYGDGRVNVNTAPRPVLVASGLGEDLADKILSARRGKDGLDMTADDHIFQQSYDIASDLSGLVKLTNEEVAHIDRLNREGKIGTISHFFSMHSTAKLSDRNTLSTVVCVFGADNHKIEYWREQ